MVFISLVWDKLSSSLAILHPQEYKIGWLFEFSATVVVGVAVAAYVWRRARTRLDKSDEVDSAERHELICSCGLPAKLRISRTSKNPYRLFYNCPKHVYLRQCEFFRWSDEISISIERYLEEKNLLRDECVRLQERIDYIQSRRQHDRAIWDREKSQLRTRLSTVQAELDDIKRKIEESINSDEMPPLDGLHNPDSGDDGALIIGTV